MEKPEHSKEKIIQRASDKLNYLKHLLISKENIVEAVKVDKNEVMVRKIVSRIRKR